MREKNLFNLMLGLNLALALAFVVYILLSSNRNPKVVTTEFPNPDATAASGSAAGPAIPPNWQSAVTGAFTTTVGIASSGTASTGTNVADMGSATNAAALASKAGDGSTNGAPAEPVFTSKKYGWRDVETDVYRTYLDSLRAVGCPEDKVRHIVMADINELMDQKRLQESIAHDPQWWKSGPDTMLVGVLQEKGRALEDQRKALIARWLGETAAETESSEAVLWSTVQLTGPTLGKLSREDHKTVQEICANSIDRYQSIFWASVNAGQTVNAVELAKMREGTRSELVKVLTPDAMEDFLLRYSHNANQLHQELSGLDPTPEEFREIFRRTDAMDHAMQLEYGTVDAMSPQQRERHARLRDQAIREVLGDKRYEGYLLTKDPLYRQAQLLARQYGAPPSAVPSLFEMNKSHEARRQAVMTDASLTPQQKQQMLQSLYQEQQVLIRKLAADAAGAVNR